MSDEQDDCGDESDDAAPEGVDVALIEIHAKLLRKKRIRRRRKLDAEIRIEADDLLATVGKKHKVRIGLKAVNDGNALKPSCGKSPSVSEPDDDDDMSAEYRKEEEDENQRAYMVAFAAESVVQVAEDSVDDVRQPLPRVVDPMEEFESYLTAEDKLAVAADIPERIFDALSPGKVPLNAMDDWLQVMVPKVVAYELKSIAADILTKFRGQSNRHQGFEHIIKVGARPDDVFDAAVAVATHVGVHMREPPFIRRYLNSCYSSVLHHQALWYIFDRVMEATNNAADCINLMRTHYCHRDSFFQEVELMMKREPKCFTRTFFFDLSYHIRVMKCNEVVAAGSLGFPDSNFNTGVAKQEAHAFLSTFCLPARLLIPCILRQQKYAVETPFDRFHEMDLEVFETSVSILGKKITERVIVAMASEIIAADLCFRQYVREQLKTFVYMSITVTTDGLKSRELFCESERFKDQDLEKKITAGSRFDFRDLFRGGDLMQGEHHQPCDIWERVPFKPLRLYHNKVVRTEDCKPDHLAQWFRLEKQGHVQLEFKYENEPSKEGGNALKNLQNQVHEIYLDSKHDADHDFNVIRIKILNEVFNNHLIPFVVREQKEAATARARCYMQMLLYRCYHTKLTRAPLQPPSVCRNMNSIDDLDDIHRIPKIMTVCHSRAGCDLHFVISAIGADGRDAVVLDHFPHQKRQLGADAINKFGSTHSNILRSDLELRHKLDQCMKRYGNIYAIVIGCHNPNTREMFRFLDEYMKVERKLQKSVYYCDEDVSRLIASGKTHANGDAYLVAESLGRFVFNPCAEVTKLFAARECPLIFRLAVHSDQGLISDAKRRDIAARVLVDFISNGKHPLSYQVFSTQPEDARLLLQFVPGIGPRKARVISSNCYGLQTREDLKRLIDSMHVIGRVVFMNCAGFIAG